MKQKKIKLSDKQNKVIKDIKGGIQYFYNPITSYRPYTKKDYGMNGLMVDGRIMNGLERAGLINTYKLPPGIYKYQLTELGKSIEL